MFFYAWKKDKNNNKSVLIMLNVVGRWVRNWTGGESGSTAVEFALVSVPFIYLLVGIIEMSLMFAAGSTLHSATNDAARLIRTGQAQTTSVGTPEDIFRGELCLKSSALLNCDLLQYEVIPLDEFADFSDYQATYDEDGNLISQGFDAGGSSDVVMIRVIYRYPLMVPLVGNLMSDGPGMTKLFMATVVLQSEPYDILEEAENL